MDAAFRRRWLPVLLALLAAGPAWYFARPVPKPGGLRVDIAVRSLYADTWELFYDDSVFTYDPAHRLTAHVEPSTAVQHLVFDLPESVHRIQGLRIDPGSAPVDVRLVALSFIGPYRTVELDADTLVKVFSAIHDLRPLELDSVHHEVVLRAQGRDPYFADPLGISPITSRALDPRPPSLRPLLPAMGAGLAVFLITAVIVRLRRPRPSAIGTSRQRPTGRVVIASVAVATLTFLLARGLANNVNFADRAIVVELALKASHADNFQVFYADKPGNFSEGYYVNAPVGATDSLQLLSFRMPADTLFKFVRLDFGDKQRALQLQRLTLRCNDEHHTYSAAELFHLFRPNPEVDHFDLEGGAVRMTFSGDDPFIYSDQDLGETVRGLWERSGNGPLPTWCGLLVAIMTLAAMLTNEQLAALLRSGRRVEWATALIFCALIAMPLLGEWLPLQPTIADTEKRPLAPEPLLRAHSLLEYPGRYNRYYGDHFAFRKMLFRWNSLFYTYALRTSSMPDNVVFGKDGYLFLIRPGVVDYYRGLPLFSDDELARIADRLEKRKAWLAERGIDYYLFVPPMKATIYRDKMPDIYARVHTLSGMDQLKAYLQAHCSVKMIDPRNELLAGREVQDTYFTTDIHWNPWGGLLGYRVLMDRLVQDHPELGQPCTPDDYVMQADTNDQGDLALQLALNDKLTRITYMMLPRDPPRMKELPERQLPGEAFFKYRPVFTQGPDPRAPKLLMFRDSFAVYLIPYLGEHFSDAVYVWSPMFIPDIVEQEHPDIVVQEVMELFLSDLLNDKVRDNI